MSSIPLLTFLSFSRLSEAVRQEHPVTALASREQREGPGIDFFLDRDQPGGDSSEHLRHDASILLPE
jgi:hypothetical protein